MQCELQNRKFVSEANIIAGIFIIMSGNTHRIFLYLTEWPQKIPTHWVSIVNVLRYVELDLIYESLCFHVTTGIQQQAETFKENLYYTYRHRNFL
jgi:hypothetical protein